jgi:hypothetical protein
MFAPLRLYGIIENDRSSPDAKITQVELELGIDSSGDRNVPRIEIRPLGDNDPSGMDSSVGGTVSGVRQTIDILTNDAVSRWSLGVNVIVSAVDVLDAAINGDWSDVGKQISGLAGGLVGSVGMPGVAVGALGVVAAALATTALAPLAGVLIAATPIVSVATAIFGAVYGEKLFE